MGSGDGLDGDPESVARLSKPYAVVAVAAAAAAAVAVVERNRMVSAGVRH
jgi:hypothetical protein